ncbi:MAG: hypothetical protein LUH00_03535 [Lachnospiraceae bacterium]|nr:hypothetical protein [Lachnospiraceae bacterium]
MVQQTLPEQQHTVPLKVFFSFFFSYRFPFSDQAVHSLLLFRFFADRQKGNGTPAIYFVSVSNQRVCMHPPPAADRICFIFLENLSFVFNLDRSGRMSLVKMPFSGAQIIKE